MHTSRQNTQSLRNCSVRSCTGLRIKQEEVFRFYILDYGTLVTQATKSCLSPFAEPVASLLEVGTPIQQSDIRSVLI